jgi:hypothetical protein
MTGFRFDVDAIKKRLKRANADLAASNFRPDVAAFAQRTLQEAIRITPVRRVSVIRSNQAKQYAKRAQYIRANPGSQTRKISRDTFIEQRAQARFLYRKSWMQCAESARLRVTASSAVKASVTRRRPEKNPPKGYVQWRGGKDVLSLVIFNPFLDQKSRYKPFTSKQILDKASAKERPRFKRDTENRIRRALYAARK